MSTELWKAEQVLYEVAWCFDERDPEGLGECFCREATLSFGVTGKRLFVERGRHDIVEFQRHAVEDTTKRRRHVISNAVLETQPDGSVRASTYLQLVLVADGELLMQSTGRYYDVLRVEDGRWRIQDRLLQLDRRPQYT